MERLIRIIIAWTIIFFGALYARAVEPADTVKVIERAERVVVVSEGSATRVCADGRDENGCETYFIYEVNVTEKDSTESYANVEAWDVDFPFFHGRSHKKVRAVRAVVGMDQLYWGWRFNYGDKGHVKNSWEWGIRNLVGVSWQRWRSGPSFEVGMGIGYRQMLADDGFCYAKDGDKLTLVPWQEEGKVGYSRLHHWTFHFPIMLKQRIGRYVGAAIGGVVNLNTYSTVSNKFVIGDKEMSVRYKGLQQNLFTVDVMASVAISDIIGVYVSWSPMPMFRNGFGPEVKSWSIGVNIMNF